MRGDNELLFDLNCRASEGFSPVSGESLHMLGVESMAKGVGDNLVGQYSMMPGVCKTDQAAGSTSLVEHTLPLSQGTHIYARRAC